MRTGTLIAWNAELKRGIIEDVMMGETWHFEAVDVNENDLGALRVGLPVWFTEADNRRATRVESRSAELTRFTNSQREVYESETSVIELDAFTLTLELDAA